MLVATAGHIDHGKTTLVRALTGVETDRLPEEKARGISIDLGFAHWHPDGGEAIGFVDVPGHERFVRNMLAGVSGVGFAMLVVAADDGVMPQTIEHLRILELLGIARGIVAITKCDRVDEGRIAELRADIAALIAHGPLAGSPTHPVSATTGTGIESLTAALIAARDSQMASPSADRGFRLSIDRAFTVAGAGTVVTGTVLSGAIRSGDDLLLVPQGQTVRVRGLQSGGAKIDTLGTGTRCALNLSGIEVGDLHRGDWLTDPQLGIPTLRIEARITLLGSCPRPLRHGSGVHVHTGASDIPARLLVPRQKAIAPGETQVVQLVLDQATSCVTGERFVLRDQSGRELLAGGIVLDPLPTPRRRNLNQRQAMAHALANDTPETAAATLAAISGFELNLRWFAHAFNLLPAALAEAIDGADLWRFGKADQLAVTQERAARLTESLLTTLGEFHAARPELGGMPRRDLRAGLGEPVSADLFAALLNQLSAAGKVITEAALVRLPDHAPAYSEVETGFWRQTLAVLEDREPRPIDIPALARELRSSEAAIRAMLQRRRANGDVWQVTENRYMLRDHVAALAALAATLGSQNTGFTAADFRDASGIGRNFVIQFLEFLDRISVTRRIGQTRKMRADFEAVVGTAPAWRRR